MPDFLQNLKNSAREQLKNSIVRTPLASLFRMKKADIRSEPLLPRETAAGIRVFATTVIRGSENHELTGYLLELDWVKNQVKTRIPIPVDTSHPLWNPRGGNRGGRGVAVQHGTLYVATAMSVLLYDRNLTQIGEISHPYLGGLHEISVDHEGIWLTSTIHDLVIKIDFQGNVIDEWWGSESTSLQHALGYSGRDLNLKLDFPPETFVPEYEKYCDEERLHVNTVYARGENVYVLSCSKKAFIQIRPGSDRVIVYDGKLGSPHNGILTPDGRVIINDTRNQCIRTYEFSSGKRLATLFTVLSDDERSVQFAKAGWQRGLAYVEGSIFLVGTSPASVFEVDIDRGSIGQVCVIDSDVTHCIHGLTIARDF